MKIGLFLDSVCDPDRGISHATVLGETMELAVDARRFHFFDPETHLAI